MATCSFMCMLMQTEFTWSIFVTWCQIAVIYADMTS